MSQEGEKLNEGTSFTLNGKDMTQQEVNALLNNVGQKVNGLLGDVGSALDGAFIKVNKKPNLDAADIRKQVQQLIPKVETSNKNGIFRMMLNGQSVIELNFSNIINRQ
ncbi:hypothetical protein AB1K84_01195 [Mesobacillus foraminis]|uniref:hypothetical protein n=1 Tax=Mesobacillus foraminis TaxID=279826 RepID=UPI000EF50ABC|nr:hypothetical protein [Mesobacillus foraminis]MBT2756342.1 hypothetical protein [Mesobacillus foraminis]